MWSCHGTNIISSLFYKYLFYLWFWCVKQNYRCLCSYLGNSFQLCLPSEEVWTCWFTFVRSVCPLSLCRSVLSVCMSHSIMQTVKHETLTQCWDNVFSPVLGYRVVFDATLNMGHRHRRRASINPPLVQSTCWYRQHEVLTRAEWILPRAE